MGLHKLLGSMLRNDIDFLEIFSYFIACIIVFLTLVYSMYYFATNYEKGQETLLNIKIISEILISKRISEISKSQTGLSFLADLAHALYM